MKLAIAATARKRQTTDVLSKAAERIEEISTDQSMHQRWKDYCKLYPYAAGIEFDQIIAVLAEITGELTEKNR